MAKFDKDKSGKVSLSEFFYAIKQEEAESDRYCKENTGSSKVGALREGGQATSLSSAQAISLIRNNVATGLSLSLYA